MQPTRDPPIVDRSLHYGIKAEFDETLGLETMIGAAAVMTMTTAADFPNLGPRPRTPAHTGRRKTTVGCRAAGGRLTARVGPRGSSTETLRRTRSKVTCGRLKSGGGARAVSPAKQVLEAVRRLHSRSRRAHPGNAVPALDHRRVARTLTLLNPRLTYHRARIVGVERIPARGGAVLVSNHGRLDFDSFVLIRLILRERGRLVRLMADHMWFRRPGVARVFAGAGAVDGTREHAIGLVARGEIVLTYPGGVREITGGRFGCEHLDWRGRSGFARVAIEAGVPVVPIVGVGVNNGFIFVSSGRFLGRLLFQRFLRLGPGYRDYRNPLAIGLLPIPLPLSMVLGLPWPCRVTYFVGDPLPPPQGDSPIVEREADFARRVEDSLRELIVDYGHPCGFTARR